MNEGELEQTIKKSTCPFSKDVYKSTNLGTVGKCACNESTVKGKVLPQTDCTAFYHQQFFVTNCNIKYDFNWNFMERMGRYIPEQHGKVVEGKDGKCK